MYPFRLCRLLENIIQRPAHNADFRDLSEFGLKFVVDDKTFLVKDDPNNVDGNIDKEIDDFSSAHCPFRYFLMRQDGKSLTWVESARE